MVRLSIIQVMTKPISPRSMGYIGCMGEMRKPRKTFAPMHCERRAGSLVPVHAKVRLRNWEITTTRKE